jgi:hypothetical protein
MAGQKKVYLADFTQADNSLVYATMYDAVTSVPIMTDGLDVLANVIGGTPYLLMEVRQTILVIPTQGGDQ